MLELTLQNFKNTLLKDKKTNTPLCIYNGIIDFQHTFIMPVQNTMDPVFIFSSIGLEGYLLNKNAIRICCSNLQIRGIPLSIKRTKNWNHRLNLYLKYSYAFVLKHNSNSYKQRKSLETLMSKLITEINNRSWRYK